MSLKTQVQTALHKFGYHLSRYNVNSNPISRRKLIFEYNKIDCVLDIGANIGHYVDETRNDLGYSGQIISFEPLSKAFTILSAKHKSDPNWKGLQIALGDKNEKSLINISDNLHSSSISPMLDYHKQLEPSSAYIGTETIEVARLDSIWPELNCQGTNIYAKLDVQGYERFTLQGAAGVLDRLKVVQLEMSLVPLYENELTFERMIAYMYELGFKLASLEPGFCDQATGNMIQVDGVFVR